MVHATQVQGRSLARLIAALVFMALLVGSEAGNARYLPDTSVGPEGRIDITLRGQGEFFPETVASSLDGLGFVSAALRGGDLAVCAYTASAQFNANFGAAGCWRASFDPRYRMRQLLTGRSGYWLLLTHESDTRDFLIVRLNAQGLPDTSFGYGGLRVFRLSCGATDTAPNCPELMGPVDSVYGKPDEYRILAETKSRNLWLLARRRTSLGFYEGVVLQIDEGGLSSARANLFDALPAAWLSESLDNRLAPIGLVAHGDGVLVKHRTRYGYVVLRVNSSVAIDRAFAASRPGGFIISGDGSMPPDLFHLPTVADDDTFVWGNIDGAADGERYDRNGQLLGPATVSGRILAAPASFKDASNPLWVFDGRRVGRWQNGQWDATSFAGHGPYTVPLALNSITLAFGGGAFALTMPSGTWEGSLSMLATAAAPSPVQAPLATQVGSALTATFFEKSAGSDFVWRSATQADGTVKWQRIDFGLAAPLPSIAVGTVPALAFPYVFLSQVLTSNASASGQRWIIRRAGSDAASPTELFADAELGGHSTRRLNLASIRGRLTPSIGNSFLQSDIYPIDLIASPGGGANLLVGFPVGTSAYGYNWHLAQLRWDANSVQNGDFQPQVQWEVQFGARVPGIREIFRDTAGGITVVESTNRVRKISPQGVWDTGFADAGTLDLTTLGFYANQHPPLLRVSAAPDGGLWFLQTQDRYGGAGTQDFDLTQVARFDGNGRLVSRFRKFWPMRPLSNNVLFSQMLGAGDGGMLLLSAFYKKSSGISLSGDYRVLRYTAGGVLDTDFGLRGAEKFFFASLTTPPSGFPDHFFALGNGNLANISNNTSNTLSILRRDPTVPGPSGGTHPVVEYYNTALNHYFMTADDEEINFVETGGAGPGWSRTGQSYLSYATMLDAPGDALDVCRFYGNPAPARNSPNGRVGPNSHFYTFAGDECRGLSRQDWGWVYEGTRLALLPLLPDDSCPAGQTIVYRAYNNGYEVRNGVWTKNDANHRYSTSSSVMDEMAAQGWALEGPRFCAPH